MAERDYEEKREKGQVPVRLFPDGVNCDIDRKPTPDEHTVRPSDLLLGTAALLPAAISVGLGVRKQIAENGSGKKKGRAA
jgi:hypothetical protein